MFLNIETLSICSNTNDAIHYLYVCVILVLTCMCLFIVPKAPLCQLLPDPGNNTAEISWLPPVDSSGKITHYEVYIIHKAICSHRSLLTLQHTYIFPTYT